MCYLEGGFYYSLMRWYTVLREYGLQYMFVLFFASGRPDLLGDSGNDFLNALLCDRYRTSISRLASEDCIRARIKCKR